MSALAIILFNRGYSISGSDQTNSKQIQALSNLGIPISLTQSDANLNTLYEKEKSKTIIIVISTAIKSSNPELLAAKAKKLKISHRAEILASLVNVSSSILVSGSHGKTTTSTLITTLLALNKKDPTAIIGGVVPYFDSNGHAGIGKYIVAEADESDGSLIHFRPEIGLITNIELDHIDHYANINSLIKTMQSFGTNCKYLLANYDCQNIRKNIKPFGWWSINESKNINFAGIPISLTGNETIAKYYENGKFLSEIRVPLPGLHNLNNVIAAIGACRIAGIKFENLKNQLQFIKSPGRRFDFRGLWKGRLIVDDYAHHPTEIKATIGLAKLIIKSKATHLPKIPKRIIAIFQPHRFSRTKEFLNDFALALSVADIILLPPIYGAGESPINGVTNEAIAKKIKEINGNITILTAKNINELIKLINLYTVKDDLILNMGAGDINNLWKKFNEESIINTSNNKTINI